MKEFFIGFLIVVVLGGVCIFSKGVSVYNTHIDLKNQIEAKQKANETIFDNTSRHDVNAGKGLTDVDYDEIINTLSETI